MTAAPRNFAGLSLDRPRLMGILNVTPDSFADGGAYGSVEEAVAAALRMVDQGASIIDVGGESSRPHAQPVTPEEEQRRVLPVIGKLAARGIIVSIDTRNAATMGAAIAAGARIVNDISALTHDRHSMAAVAQSEASVVLMHMRGTPEDMHRRTDYADVVGEVTDWLIERAAICEAAGIHRQRIALDPGIGFAKTAAQSLALLQGIGRLLEFGYPVLIGASRKSFLQALGGGATPSDRLAASLAVAVDMASRGVQLLRVHDVAETALALAMASAGAGASASGGSAKEA